MSGHEAEMRPLMMSGHCAYPQTRHPEESHARCRGGQRANPGKVYQPCPCFCHFTDAQEFECGGCGAVIVLAEHWPLDADGDNRYTHIDHAGRATGEECGAVAVSRNRTVEVLDPEPEAEPDTKTCSRCDATFIGNSDNPLCPTCGAKPEQPVVYVPAEVDEFDALLAEMDEEV